MINVTVASTVSNSSDIREVEQPESLIGVTGKLVMFWAEHTLPMPCGIGLDAGNTLVELRFSSRQALDAWYAALGPAWGSATVSTQPYSYNGSDEMLHNAYSRRWGWNVYLVAHTPNAPSTEEPEPTPTTVERDAEARATEGGRTPYDATVEDAPIPATLGCPRCSHTEYASEEDPDAGLSAMHNHIFSYHADRDPEATIALLTKVTAEVFAS